MSETTSGDVEDGRIPQHKTHPPKALNVAVVRILELSSFLVNDTKRTISTDPKTNCCNDPLQSKECNWKKTQTIIDLVEEISHLRMLEKKKNQRTNVHFIYVLRCDGVIESARLEIIRHDTRKSEICKKEKEVIDINYRITHHS